jgi:anti-sigma B factor antagonist
MRQHPGIIVRNQTSGETMARGFSLETKELDAGAVCVAVEGEFDMWRAYDFDRALLSIEDGGASTIVVDLRGVQFLDSAGLARILAAHRRAERNGHRFAVVRGCRAVERLLAMAALDRRLEMVSEPEAALAPG